MEVSGVPAKRLEPGRVLKETFSIYRDNLGALLGSALVVFAIAGIFFALLVESGKVGLQVLAIPLEFAATALYTGFVVKLVQDVRDGRRDSTVGDLFSAAAPAILPLVAFTILYGLGVVFGFLLLVVPGLILLTIWSLGPAAIVVERIGPLKAFGRSRRLVRGNGWSVFLVLFVAGVIAVAASFGLEALVSAIADGVAVAYVATVVASALAAPIAALAVAIMYFDLGGGREVGAPVAEQPAPSAPPV
jgi:hypothetical protein